MYVLQVEEIPYIPCFPMGLPELQKAYQQVQAEKAPRIPTNQEIEAEQILMPLQLAQLPALVAPGDGVGPPVSFVRRSPAEVPASEPAGKRSTTWADVAAVRPKLWSS